MHSGGHKGYYLKSRPSKYLQTPQQSKFREALEFCGIKKGITKSELMTAMKNCIPRFFREHRDGS